VSDRALIFDSDEAVVRHLMTLADVARFHGVTNECARQWQYRARGFPDPVGTVGKSAVWARPDIESFVQPRPRKVWTKERIKAAVRHFNLKYGSPPAATDWNVGRLRQLGDVERLARFAEDGCYPHLSNVYGANGAYDSWADAIEDAGFQRPETGRYERPGRVYRRRVVEDVDAALGVES
jgi:hypothetical protein